MGSYMAQNLIKNGYKVVVNDVYPEAMATLEDLGAKSVLTPAEVAKNVTRIITMLPSRYSPFQFEITRLHFDTNSLSKY